MLANTPVTVVTVNVCIGESIIAIIVGAIVVLPCSAGTVHHLLLPAIECCWILAVPVCIILLLQQLTIM